MAQHDSQSLYLRFEVSEPSLVVERFKDDKREVVNSDRVELFFAADVDLQKYYCLELDPFGRILDYSASYYREFDYDWSWPQDELAVDSKLVEKGYQVELVLSKASLKQLGLIQSNMIHMGVFRADCKGVGRGGTSPKRFDWISWVDPGTKMPDFHVPGAFGRFHLLSSAPDQR